MRTPTPEPIKVEVPKKVKKPKTPPPPGIKITEPVEISPIHSPEIPHDSLPKISVPKKVPKPEPEPIPVFVPKAVPKKAKKVPPPPPRGSYIALPFSFSNVLDSRHILFYFNLRYSESS